MWYSVYEMLPHSREWFLATVVPRAERENAEALSSWRDAQRDAPAELSDTDRARLFIAENRAVRYALDLAEIEEFVTSDTARRLWSSWEEHLTRLNAEAAARDALPPFNIAAAIAADPIPRSVRWDAATRRMVLAYPVVAEAPEPWWAVRERRWRAR